MMTQARNVENGDLINELVSSNNYHRPNARNKSRKTKKKTKSNNPRLGKSGSLVIYSIAFFKGLLKKPNKRKKL